MVLFWVSFLSAVTAVLCTSPPRLSFEHLNGKATYLVTIVPDSLSKPVRVYEMSVAGLEVVSYYPAVTFGDAIGSMPGSIRAGTAASTMYVRAIDRSDMFAASGAGAYFCAANETECVISGAGSYAAIAHTSDAAPAAVAGGGATAYLTCADFVIPPTGPFGECDPRMNRGYVTAHLRTRADVVGATVDVTRVAGAVVARVAVVPETTTFEPPLPTGSAGAKGAKVYAVGAVSEADALSALVFVTALRQRLRHAARAQRSAKSLALGDPIDLLASCVSAEPVEYGLVLRLADPVREYYLQCVGQSLTITRTIASSSDTISEGTITLSDLSTTIRGVMFLVGPAKLGGTHASCGSFCDFSPFNGYTLSIEYEPLAEPLAIFDCMLLPPGTQTVQYALSSISGATLVLCESHVNAGTMSTSNLSLGYAYASGTTGVSLPLAGSTVGLQTVQHPGGVSWSVVRPLMSQVTWTVPSTPGAAIQLKSFPAVGLDLQCTADAEVIVRISNPMRDYVAKCQNSAPSWAVAEGSSQLPSDYISDGRLLIFDASSIVAVARAAAEISIPSGTCVSGAFCTAAYDKTANVMLVVSSSSRATALAVFDCAKFTAGPVTITDTTSTSVSCDAASASMGLVAVPLTAAETLSISTVGAWFGAVATSGSPWTHTVVSATKGISVDAPTGGATLIAAITADPPPQSIIASCADNARVLVRLSDPVRDYMMTCSGTAGAWARYGPNTLGSDIIDEHILAPAAATAYKAILLEGGTISGGGVCSATSNECSGSLRTAPEAALTLVASGSGLAVQIIFDCIRLSGVTSTTITVFGDITCTSDAPHLGLAVTPGLANTPYRLGSGGAWFTMRGIAQFPDLTAWSWVLSGANKELTFPSMGTASAIVTLGTEPPPSVVGGCNGRTGKVLVRFGLPVRRDYHMTCDGLTAVWTHKSGLRGDDVVDGHVLVPGAATEYSAIALEGFLMTLRPQPLDRMATLRAGRAAKPAAVGCLDQARCDGTFDPAVPLELTLTSMPVAPLVLFDCRAAPMIATINGGTDIVCAPGGVTLGLAASAAVVDKTYTIRTSGYWFAADGIKQYPDASGWAPAFSGANKKLAFTTIGTATAVVVLSMEPPAAIIGECYRQVGKVLVRLGQPIVRDYHMTCDGIAATWTLKAGPGGDDVVDGPVLVPGAATSAVIVGVIERQTSVGPRVAGEISKRAASASAVVAGCLDQPYCGGTFDTSYSLEVSMTATELAPQLLIDCIESTMPVLVTGDAVDRCDHDDPLTLGLLPLPAAVGTYRLGMSTPGMTTGVSTVSIYTTASAALWQYELRAMGTTVQFMKVDAFTAYLKVVDVVVPSLIPPLPSRSPPPPSTTPVLPTPLPTQLPPTTVPATTPAPAPAPGAAPTPVPMPTAGPTLQPQPLPVTPVPVPVLTPVPAPTPAPAPVPVPAPVPAPAGTTIEEQLTIVANASIPVDQRAAAVQRLATLVSSEADMAEVARVLLAAGWQFVLADGVAGCSDALSAGRAIVCFAYARGAAREAAASELTLCTAANTADVASCHNDAVCAAKDAGLTQVACGVYSCECVRGGSSNRSKKGLLGLIGLVGLIPLAIAAALCCWMMHGRKEQPSLMTVPTMTCAELDTVYAFPSSRVGHASAYAVPSVCAPVGAAGTAFGAVPMIIV